MKRKSIMVDMDDVLTLNGFTKVVQNYLGHDINDETPNYRIQDLLGDKKQDFFETYFEHNNFYDVCDIAEDSVEVLEQLNKYYDVYICTAYIWPERQDLGGKVIEWKFNYLQKVYPFLDRYKFIFINDKSMCNFDIRIDDKLSNFSKDSQNLYFTAYHNRHIEDNKIKEHNATRVNNWKEIESILLKDM